MTWHNLCTPAEALARRAVRVAARRGGDPFAAAVARVPAWDWHAPSATLSGETEAGVCVTVALGEPVPPFRGRALAVDLEAADGRTATGALTLADQELAGVLTHRHGGGGPLDHIREALDRARRSLEPEGAS